jgi:two-component system, chemotaxis family, chemotaxis protein CheY
MTALFLAAVNRILIVDDSPTIRRMVRASLLEFQSECDFVEASSGLEAIERLGTGSVELMVLDLNMPDMHGLEVLGFVRGHAKYCEVPVLVLTTRGDESHRTAALQAGATAYMTKPFVPQELAAQAKQLLDRHLLPGPP